MSSGSFSRGHDTPHMNDHQSELPSLKGGVCPSGCWKSLAGWLGEARSDADAGLRALPSVGWPYLSSDGLVSVGPSQPCWASFLCLTLSPSDRVR